LTTFLLLHLINQEQTNKSGRISAATCFGSCDLEFVRSRRGLLPSENALHRSRHLAGAMFCPTLIRAWFAGMIRLTTAARMGVALRRCRRCYLLPALFGVCALAIAPASAQPTAAEFQSYRARIDAAVRAVGDHPRLQALPPKKREELAEFVSGNLLFTLLHEMAHAAINQFDLPVLGKEEDAADSFAATRLIRIGSEFSDQVVASAAKSWFLMDRRDRKEGETVPYYDEHGLDQQRAYQIDMLRDRIEREQIQEAR
jgi:hypothetical protein